MRRIWLLSVAFTLTSLVASVPLARVALDEPVVPSRRFEAASVKRNYVPMFVQRPSGKVTRGRFTAVNWTLRQLIQYAYDFTAVAAQISGGPKWIDSAGFDIVATAPGASADDIRLCLRRLLAERFAMVTHIDTRTLRAYRLVVMRPGRLGRELKLTPCEGDPDEQHCGTTGWGPGFVIAHSVTMDRFATSLEGYGSAFADVDRFVVNDTGLPGTYSFQVRFSPSGRQFEGLAQREPDPDLPSFTTALQEQLGLMLQPGSAPGKIVVIESAEFPTGN